MVRYLTALCSNLASRWSILLQLEKHEALSSAVLGLTLAMSPFLLMSTHRYAGYGNYGRLGSGASTTEYTMTRMPDVNDIRKFNQWGYAGVVLTGGGAVWYWPYVTSTSISDYTVTEMGYGIFLGDDDNSLGSTYGVDGFKVSPVTDVAASGYSNYPHWCAVVAYTGMECWGSNLYGQLGDGTNTNAYTQPVTVQGLPAGNITSVSCGEWATCAVVNGTAWCWGYNSYGQLGDGTTTNAHTPVQVVDLPGNVTAIELEMANGCALVMDGDVYCWGLNGKGQLGDGTTTTSYTPVKVQGLEDVVVTQISMGYYITS